MVEYLREVTPGSTAAEIREMLYLRFGVLFSLSAIKNAKMKFGAKAGIRVGCFPRGHVPHNKGRRMDEYLTPEQIEHNKLTRFKPGHEPNNGLEYPVGAERVNAEGYVEVKVRSLGERPGMNDCWELKHRLVWEREHGPIPESHIVIFIDGDKANCDPANLACISRADAGLMNLRGLSYHDAATLQVALDIVRLGSAVFDKSRPERACRRCGRAFKPRYPHQRTCDVCLGRTRPESTPRDADRPNSDDQSQSGIDARGNEISD